MTPNRWRAAARLGAQCVGRQQNLSTRGQKVRSKSRTRGSSETVAARRLGALRAACIAFVVGYPLLWLGESILDKREEATRWLYILVGLASSMVGIGVAELYARAVRRKLQSQFSAVRRNQGKESLLRVEQNALNHSLFRLILSRERSWILSGGQPRLRTLLFSLNSVSTYVIFLGGATLLLFEPDLSRLAGWPATLIAGTFGGCILIRLFWLLLLMKNFRKLHADDRLVIGSSLAFFTADILSATCMLVTYLYYFGAVDAVGSVIGSILPSLSPGIRSFLSQAVSWLFAAATSGLAWDIMKRLGSRMRQGRLSKGTSARAPNTGGRADV